MDRQIDRWWVGKKCVYESNGYCCPLSLSWLLKESVFGMCVNQSLGFISQVTTVVERYSN